MNNLSSYKGIIVNVSKILIKTGEKEVKRKNFFNLLVQNEILS